MSWEEIKLQISEEIKRRLEDRHVLEDELKQVIYQAETDGNKLYQPDKNKYLAKSRIGNTTFYVEYAIEQGYYVVSSAYAHKSEITG